MSREEYNAGGSIDDRKKKYLKRWRKENKGYHAKYSKRWRREKVKKLKEMEEKALSGDLCYPQELLNELPFNFSKQFEFAYKCMKKDWRKTDWKLKEIGGK